MRTESTQTYTIIFENNTDIQDWLKFRDAIEKVYQATESVADNYVKEARNTIRIFLKDLDDK